MENMTQKFVTLYHQNIDGGQSESDVARLPEFVKNYPEGCFRSLFFHTVDSQCLYGPMVLTFAIRKARDLLLEGCEYQGVEIQIETAGKRLPQLPAARELEKLVDSTDTIIHINGTPYKPSTEVFGFQQVYDDSVKCIEELKKLGFTQETMTIYATPEEITVELHGGAIGAEGIENPGDYFYRLLCNIANIKDAAGKPAKTTVKTVILQACQKGWKVLLPGCNHPALHRPRVAVGPSHFAYGIAAFSDYCGKKRTPQESLQESLNWVKFIQTQFPPIPGLKAKIEKMPQMPWPGQTGPGNKTTMAGATTLSSRFQPLKNSIEENEAAFIKLTASHSTTSTGLNKSLGGGWSSGGIHVIAGPRESGKAGFLQQLLFAYEKELPILCISFEHNIREFVTRTAAIAGNCSLSDIPGALYAGGATAEQAKMVCGAAISKLKNQINNNIYFSGTETNRQEFDPDEIQQLAAMMPGNTNKLVLIDSLDESAFADDFNNRMRRLREVAGNGNLTIIMTVHAAINCGKRPHFLEEDDLPLLEKYQKYTDSLVVMLSEKVNLRRFVAMVKGQIDAQLVGNLEQKALQMASGKRFKTDTYNLVRVIHTRTGKRDLLLYLYQPELVKYFELASINISRP